MDGMDDVGDSAGPSSLSRTGFTRRKDFRSTATPSSLVRDVLLQVLLNLGPTQVLVTVCRLWEL